MIQVPSTWRRRGRMAQDVLILGVDEEERVRRRVERGNRFNSYESYSGLRWARAPYSASKPTVVSKPRAPGGARNEVGPQLCARFRMVLVG